MAEETGTTHSFNEEKVHLVIKSTGEIVARYICENDIKVEQVEGKVIVLDIVTGDTTQTYLDCTIKIINQVTFNKEFLDNPKDINYWNTTDNTFGYKDFTTDDTKAERAKELKEIALQELNNDFINDTIFGKEYTVPSKILKKIGYYSTGEGGFEIIDADKYIFTTSQYYINMLLSKPIISSIINVNGEEIDIGNPAILGKALQQEQIKYFNAYLKAKAKLEAE